ATAWDASRSAPAGRDAWRQVDLGTATELDAVRAALESASRAQYAVPVSDEGDSWTTVATFGSAAGDENVARLDTLDLETEDGTVPSARYLRMQGLRGDPGYGY